MILKNQGPYVTVSEIWELPDSRPETLYGRVEGLAFRVSKSPNIELPNTKTLTQEAS